MMQGACKALEVRHTVARGGHERKDRAGSQLGRIRVEVR
jgi:hypothetical protein